MEVKGLLIEELELFENKYIKQENKDHLEVEKGKEDKWTWDSADTNTAQTAMEAFLELTIQESTAGHSNKEAIQDEDKDQNAKGLSQEQHGLDDLKCYLCSKIFSTVAAVRGHMSRKHGLASGIHCTCPLCGSIASNRASLKRHMLRTHGKNSLLQSDFMKECRHCGEGLTSQGALNQHIRQLHQDQLHQYKCCSLCPAIFVKQQSFLHHFGARHPGQSVPGQDQVCAVCEAGFNSQAALRMHLKHSHPHYALDLNKCTTCSATFKYPYLLSRHIKTMHKSVPKARKPRQFQLNRCSLCSREFKLKYHLERHMKISHMGGKTRVFECPTCGQAFATKGQSTRHQRRVHYDRTRVRCSECYQLFDTVQDVNAHRQREHKQTCNICNKSFVSRDTLREHLLIHSGHRLPCPHCHKSFTQSSNLKRHIRIHTGEKPFKCCTCDKVFGDKSAYNSHIRVHTRPDWCHCALCGASFSKQQKLQHHMRTHTDQLQCSLCAKSTKNPTELKQHIETHQQAVVQVITSMGLSTQGQQLAQLALDVLHNLAIATTRKNRHYVTRNSAEAIEFYKNEVLSAPDCDDNELYILEKLRTEDAKTYDQMKTINIGYGNAKSALCEDKNSQPKISHSKGSSQKSSLSSCCSDDESNTSLIDREDCKKVKHRREETTEEASSQQLQQHDEPSLCPVINFNGEAMDSQLEISLVNNEIETPKASLDYKQKPRKKRRGKSLQSAYLEELFPHCNQSRHQHQQDLDNDADLSEEQQGKADISEESKQALRQLLQCIYQSQFSVQSWGDNTVPAQGNQLVEKCLEVIINDQHAECMEFQV